MRSSMLRSALTTARRSNLVGDVSRASIRSFRPLVAVGVSFPTTSQTQQMKAMFSSEPGSHDDFAPQRKQVASDEEEALKMIAEHVKNNPVMLYMKGSPNMPMCGFSAQVTHVLKKEGIDFSSVNVLDYPAIREGIKKFSQWPTIPQLYINGEFIGGCDIVLSMHETGELGELLSQINQEP